MSVGQLAGPTTPTDALPTSVGAPAVPKKRAKRQRRYELFDDGQGDYRIYQIADASSKLPPGSLIPIPEIGGHKTSVDAIAAVKKSGQVLMNKQVLIFRGLQIMRVELETQPQVKVTAKERKQISGAPQDSPTAG
jgi:hypothetical protein